MKFYEILEIENEFHGSATLRRKNKHTTKGSNEYSRKSIRKYCNINKKRGRNRQKDILRPDRFERAQQPMEILNRQDYYDYDYDYDYDRYNDDYYDRWYDDHPERGWERWDEFDQRQQPHDALPKDDSECSVCCGEFFVPHTKPPAFDETFSFKQALLAPRKPVPAVRTADHVDRAHVGSESGVCVECMLAHLRNELAAVSRSIYAEPVLRCPRCRYSTLSMDNVRTFLAQRPDGADVLALMSNMLRRRALLAGQDVKTNKLVDCVNQRCNSFFLVNVAGSRCSHVQCPDCLTDICFVCKTAYHFGSSCHQEIQRDEQLKWKHENTRPCPRCTEPIEKNGGCSHMICRVCKLDFQWYQTKDGLFVPKNTQKVILRDASLRAMRPVRVLVKTDLPDPLASTDRYVVGAEYADGAARRERRRRLRQRRRARELERIAMSLIKNSMTDSNEPQSTPATTPTSHAPPIPIYMQTIAI